MQVFAGGGAIDLEQAGDFRLSYGTVEVELGDAINLVSDGDTTGSSVNVFSTILITRD